MPNENAHGAGRTRGGAGAQWQGEVRELSRGEACALRWDAASSRGVSHADPQAVVLGYILRGRLCGLAEIVPSRPGSGGWAEAMLSVAPAWQDCGIGSLLMAHVLDHARERGIDHLYLRCHALNARMQSIAEKFGATFAFDDCECFAHFPVARAAACH